MPRRPRLDYPGGLYHVMARGVDRGLIFRDDRDRSDFVRRLATLTVVEGIVLFAFVLMDNHFHLVLRRMQRPLGHFLQRLLTGYSVKFNLRHQRVGHVFQNRYKSLLCENEEYLLELVRYVHLNPIRAGIVQEPAAYRWSSHRLYLQLRPPAWLEARAVLDLFGGHAAYAQFLRQVTPSGRRPELVGESNQSSQSERKLWHGNQVLGAESFARRVLSETPMKIRDENESVEPRPFLPELGARMAAQFGITVPVLLSRTRLRAVSHARHALIHTAVLEQSIRPGEVARYLGISSSAVAQHLRGTLRRN
jgi:putative transposase